ncbi:MAG: OmpA family protein [Spirochaetota bacterium]|nr:MAG: OmpA family protein [Spirochaetota bacterium]
MKKIILLLLFLSIGFTLNAQESFRFQYSIGQKFHIDGIIDEDVYRNDLFIKAVRIRNVGDLTVTEISGDKALHEGVFDYYQSDGGSDFVHENSYPTKFFRDIYGNYEISNAFFMPVVRGVPTFPETPLDIGDQWTSKAYEAHDFRQVFGIENPVILPASVSYQYLGNSTIDGEKIAKISINYVINYTLKYQTGGEILGPLPFRVVGYFNQLYFWNLERGIPHSYKENFDYIFIMSDGVVVEYTGKARATLTVTESSLENNRIASKIQRKLEKEIPSVQVSAIPEGIIINIGEILFKFDSDELTEGASEDLDNIVDVLREFPDRRIRIIGHTDSTGPHEYNLSLSLRRAKTTANELRDRLSILKDRLTYIGMGESRPIASNETEEGRRKNRRVEILILNE